MTHPALEQLRGRPSPRPRCPSRRARRSGRTPGPRAPDRPGSGSRRGRRPRPGRPACRTPGTSPASRTRARRRSVARRSGRTTSGITSPAFWRTTQSPIRMSLRRTSSRLWSVARATVEPATLTGVRCATGRERSRPADVRHDVLDERLDLLGRELEGDRPARRPADHPEPCLLVDPVDLDDDAIGLVREVVACLAPVLGEVDDAVDVEIGGVLRVDREAEGRKTREGRRLGRDGVAVLDQLVEPGRQLPAGRDRRVDLAERARRRCCADWHRAAGQPPRAPR